METNALLSNLFGALEAKNQAQIEAGKNAIIQRPATNEEVVKAKFRLGMHALHVEKNIALAFQLLKEAAQSSVECDSRLEALIMFAGMLWNQQDKKAALSSLDFVIKSSKKPTVLTSAALDFMSIFLREDNADPKIIKKIDNDRVTQLNELEKEMKDIKERTFCQLRLAHALEDRNAPGDLQKAKELYSAIVKSPSNALADTRKAASDALKRLQ